MYYFFKCDKISGVFFLCFNDIHITVPCNLPMKYDKMKNKENLSSVKTKLRKICSLSIGTYSLFDTNK